MNRRKRGKWKYRNLSMVVVSIICALLLSRNEGFHNYLLHLGGYGYAGAFLAGILFVSTFTVATSAVILLVLAETLSPIEIGLIAGVGAVLGDILIFRLIKDDLASEIMSLYTLFDRKRHLQKLLYSRYFNWSLPVIGALIIASPLPDEMGISLMNLSKMSPSKFLLVSYVLNSIGIFAVVSASAIIQP